MRIIVLKLLDLLHSQVFLFHKFKETPYKSIKTVIHQTNNDIVTDNFNVQKICSNDLCAHCVPNCSLKNDKNIYYFIYNITMSI